MWLSLAALAQDLEPDGQQTLPDADIEIEVVDERAALARLETSLAVEGYHLEARRGPWRVYKNYRGWMATLLIHDEGFMAVKKPLVREMALRIRGDWRAVRNRQGQTVDGVQDEVAAWRRAQQHRIHQERMAVLADRLEALWLDGTPWESSDPHSPGERPTLESRQQRKDALLALWETRADTPEGEAVRQMVRAFVIHEVWPVLPPTDEERARLGE